jgi:hypothetical protein
MELLCCCERGQVPGVAVVIFVLSLASNSDGLAFRDAAIDIEPRAERISDCFVVRESSGRTGLEIRICAIGCGIECVNRRKDRVRVHVGPSLLSVKINVRLDVAASPEAFEEAKDLRSGFCAAAARFSEPRRKVCAFGECAVNRGDREERGSHSLFPEIEAGLVPVAEGVCEILCND